jgi:hypothetical protein
MLLAATPDAAGKSDKLLRRLAELLPDHWLVIANIPSRAVTDKKRRGRTRPLDAIVIGEKTMFVIEVRSYPGVISVRDKQPFQADGRDIEHKDNKPDGFWARFQKEAYKVKVMMQERFGVDTIQVMPKIVWSRSQRFEYGDSGREEDVTDARTFVRLAARRDKASSHAPFASERLLAIARFLVDDAQLDFDGDVAPAVVDGTAPDHAHRARELAEAEWFQVGGEDRNEAGPRAADRMLASEGAMWRRLWLAGALLLLGAVATLLWLQVGTPEWLTPSSPPTHAAPAPRQQRAAPPAAAETVGAPPVAVAASAAVTKAELREGAASRASARPSSSAVERRASIGEGGRRQARPARRKAAPTAAAASATSGTISCILPSGDEIRTGYTDCRARSGVIYR